MKYGYVTLLLLLFTTTPFFIGSLNGQNQIQGKIIDSTSREAIPFATIRFKNSAIGVVSNADGDFQISARYKTLKDSLIISCIGYTNKSIDVSQLSDEQLNIIILAPSAYDLQTAIVSATKKKLSPHKILRAAFKKIPDNYPQEPFSYMAYYRDYQLEVANYINLNEAIVEIFDQGFSTTDRRSTKIRLHKYVPNEEFERDMTTAIAYDNKEKKFIPNATLSSFGGNELSILRLHDAIRNYDQDSYSFVYKLSRDLLLNHSFELLESVTLNDVPLYTIAFQSAKRISGINHFSEGKIYVEHENFAIHKLEYATYEKYETDTTLLYDISVEYIRQDSLMYLNYISFNNLFKTSSPPKFVVDNMYIRQDRKAFLLFVNNHPDTTFALKKENYEIRLDDKKMKIKAVEMPYDKQIWIFMDEKEMKKIIEDPGNWTPKLEFMYKNVRDKEGNLLNQTIHKNVKSI